MEKFIETRNMAREDDYIKSLQLDGSPEALRRCRRVQQGQIMWEAHERALNCLYRHGITSDYQLLQKTPQELLDITNFGQLSLDRVIWLYKQFGYELAKESK